MNDQTKKSLLDQLAAQAMAADDPIRGLDVLLDEFRARLLRAALEAEGWNLNATARRLRRSTSTIQYMLMHTYPDLNDERLRHLAAKEKQ